MIHVYTLAFVDTRVKRIHTELKDLGVNVGLKEVYDFISLHVDCIKEKSLDTSYFVGEYVVIRTSMEGGGTVMFNDHYPDGWHITARKLNKDSTYCPDGILINFYQSGSFSIVHESVETLRKMELTFK